MRRPRGALQLAETLRRHEYGGPHVVGGAELGAERLETETICALATPPGRSAIAVVRVSGPLTRDAASRVFRSQRSLEPHVATYGAVLAADGAPIDRGIAILGIAPATYTGEDTLELQLHGSPVVVRETVQSLLACGIRYALPGEFTRRAFLNGSAVPTS